MLNLPLLLFVLILSHVPTASTTGCFKADGSTSHDDEWPCDPDADTSLCCGATDYCLGSVMCLDTGADNMLSLQGCTNSSWPEACNPMCPGTSEYTESPAHHSAYLPLPPFSPRCSACVLSCEHATERTNTG